MLLGSRPCTGRHCVLVPGRMLLPRLVCPVMTQYEPSFVAVTGFAPLMIVFPLPVPISFCPVFNVRGCEIL